MRGSAGSEQHRSGGFRTRSLPPSSPRHREPAMANWIPLPNEAKYRQMVSMSLNVSNMERSQGLWLPNLRAHTHLVLVSDYAGEGPRAKFHVLSYLLASRQSLYQWDANRVAIRKQFLHNER